MNLKTHRSEERSKRRKISFMYEGRESKSYTSEMQRDKNMEKTIFTQKTASIKLRNSIKKID
jgi:hypothetical protein